MSLPQPLVASTGFGLACSRIHLSIPRHFLPAPGPSLGVGTWFHWHSSPSQPDAGKCLPYGSTSPDSAFSPSKLSRAYKNQPPEKFQLSGAPLMPTGCPYHSATESNSPQRQVNTCKGALKYPSTLQRVWVRPSSAPVLSVCQRLSHITAQQPCQAPRVNWPSASPGPLPPLIAN